MTEQSGVTASETPKKRGPKSQAEIRAEVEANIRAEVEAQVRAEMEEQMAAERRQAELDRAAASDTKPLSAFQISGDPTNDGAVTIHFVDDGFTVLGKVWYRGEELVLVPGTPQWAQSPFYKDQIFALLDEFDQEEIWGRRFFRQGPWRGKRLSEIDDEVLTDEDRVALAKAEQIRTERFGAGVAPVMPRSR